MSTCCIVIPCYNEGQRLDAKVFCDFLRENHNVSFLFVDDGSQDNTRDKLESMRVQSSKVNYISLVNNQGKAEAVRQGVLQVISQSHTYVGYWDADLAAPLSEIARFVSFLEQHSEVAFLVGSRVKLLGKNIQRKAHRHYLGRIFATCASLVLGLGVYDTQCGAKIFRSHKNLEDVFARPFLSRWIFDVEIFSRWQKLADSSAIYEMPLETWCDVGGSKVKARDFFRALIDLLKIYFRRNSPN